MPTAVHFGAGNIGRGFIGPMLSEAGYKVVFADIDEETINKLQDFGYYDVYILDDKEVGKPVQELNIHNVSGLLSNSPEIIDEIAYHADIITTAVGPPILAKIAGTLAEALTKRAEKGEKKNLNIIACENMVGATAKLREHVLEHLPSDPSAPVHTYISSYVGFANCSVDRIVPPQNQIDLGESSSQSESSTASSDLDVAVENYHEWVVEEAALRKPLPLEIPDMKLTDNLTSYIERKLYTLNTGHAITAYLGFLYQKPTIDAAMADPHIYQIVKLAMKESGEALRKKHGFDFKVHRHYIHHILARFQNPNLKDQVIRVGRGPLRKLGKEDRLLGPIGLCKEYGLPRDNLLIGVAAALRYDNPQDEESVELQKKIKEKGVESYVKELVGEEDSAAVVRQYQEFGQSKQLN